MSADDERLVCSAWPRATPVDSQEPSIASITIPFPSAHDFGQRPMLARHDLTESDLFTDTALIDLLDRFPRKSLHALSMGTDPTRSDQNQLALNEGVSGGELLRAVRNGRLWLNLTRVERADARFRELIDELYAQIAVALPGFKAKVSQANLLISSPHALVYYHADGPASVLWHVRGRKRVWVYPALDTRYVAREALEDIFAGARHEYLPYEPGFDTAAVTYDLEPGQWIIWPQNAPHRITNLDSLNVSLVTEHYTAQTRRRARVYKANRFLRLRLGLSDLSTRESGPAALFKTLVHGLARKVGLDHTQPKQHTPTLRVDADAAGGVVALAPQRNSGNEALA